MSRDRALPDLNARTVIRIITWLIKDLPRGKVESFINKLINISQSYRAIGLDCNRVNPQAISRLEQAMAEI